MEIDFLMFPTVHRTAVNADIGVFSSFIVFIMPSQLQYIYMNILLSLLVRWKRVNTNGLHRIEDPVGKPNPGPLKA
jgi:hypothetical protein